MGTLQIDIVELPETPLDAAADFYSRDLPEIRDDSDIHPDCDIVLLFERATHEHRAWRLAAIQELARELSPRRVNALSGGSEEARIAAVAYLAAAPGVTGQYLPLDGAGAGPVLSSRQ